MTDYVVKIPVEFIFKSCILPDVLGDDNVADITSKYMFESFKMQ